MKIAVIGAGYVGLVTAACLTEMGNRVVCVDAAAQKVAALKRGEMPIYEPGLEDIVVSALNAGLLDFTTSLESAVASADYVFIAVGTPMQDDGRCDTSAVLSVARALGQSLTDDAIVITKSTVPVGTGDQVESIIQERLRLRNAAFKVDVVSNPEFLKEGAAVADFMTPDRIIVGSDSQHAREMMGVLYAPYLRRNDRILYMGRREAEMTKYASNAMLAARISFMNEIAELCEHCDVDVEDVRLGMGADKRIGNAFLFPGAGYGGSCLPKDVRALIATGEDRALDMCILKSVDERNQAQKRVMFDKLYRYFDGQLEGKAIAVWGLAFKPGTDDIREAPALNLIEKLVEAGARIVAYDPVAMANTRRYFAKFPYAARVRFVDEPNAAVVGADALVVVTEWKRFRQPDFRSLKLAMRGRLIVDGRNLYHSGHLSRIGFDYRGVGRDNKGLNPPHRDRITT
ncbi:UDPglucose 6-dehydrogenase [Litorivivens lipolytica]|uniref:UDP-glucose 6-dehydrogenase n=1 Tax=Litorivivens lipolytica TaxID=1524264 RepID=A0A7W4Z5G2_9GAMM|nr:UDP-glucose/GDP-mannose dehydrogenase family protein [Litorivivens lipolytica]MBB3047479.1 UDPglucose 6-dehydrogenase [Litorivivens lipolytica]